jgi:hypothetical protein
MQPENPEELIQLYRFKDFECHNLFYGYQQNEFFVKRSEKNKLLYSCKMETCF